MSRLYGEVRYLPPNNDRRRGVWLLADVPPHVQIKLKRLFPRLDPYRGSQRQLEIDARWTADNKKGRSLLSLTDTPEIARDLAWVLERWPMELDDGSRKWMEQRVGHQREVEDAIDRILDGAALATDTFLEPARHPYDYQQQASDLLLARGALLLGDDVGLGKSFSGLMTFRDPRALPGLVVCYPHLQRQWLDELHKSFPTLVPHVLRKGQPYDFRDVRALRGREPDVLISTYNKLDGWAPALAGKVRAVIYDEMQELRRPESRKYQAAALISDQADFNMGLTASPVYNYGGEIHSVAAILEPDTLGSREEFGREWGLGSDRKQKVRDPEALGSYLRDIGLLLRRTRAEVGRELPPEIRIPHMVDTDLDLYDEMTRKALDLAQLLVDGAGTREERFQASGDLDWQVRQATGVAKAPYVAEFVRLLLDSGEPVVVWGWHREVYDILRAKLEDFEPAMYTGSETPAAKDREARRFLDGDTPVMLMSLRAGAGLDGLQERCKVGVFAELDWSPKVHDQCIGRLRRDGMGVDPVVAYFLHCDHGSDPVVAEVLELKRMQSEAIMNPTGDLLVGQTIDATERIRRLAESVLEQRRQAVVRKHGKR